jgi:hypothetical protein
VEPYQDEDRGVEICYISTRAMNEEIAPKVDLEPKAKKQQDSDENLRQ